MAGGTQPRHNACKKHSFLYLCQNSAKINTGKYSHVQVATAISMLLSLCKSVCRCSVADPPTPRFGERKQNAATNATPELEPAKRVPFAELRQCVRVEMKAKCDVQVKNNNCTLWEFYRRITFRQAKEPSYRFSKARLQNGWSPQSPIDFERRLP